MSLSVEDLRKDLESFEGVTIEDEGEFFNVKMQYERGASGKEKWNAINHILKGYAGEWISNGKWSHWKVPRQQTAKPESREPSTVTKEQLLEWMIGEVDKKIEGLQFLKARLEAQKK